MSMQSVAERTAGVDNKGRKQTEASRSVRVSLALSALGALGFVLVPGCGDDTGGVTEAKSLSVATYNAGLAYNFVPLAEERVPTTLDAIAALDADIVCVQEVWEAKDVTSLKSKASAFAGQIFLDPQQDTSGEIPCQDATAIENIRTCATAKCEDPPTVDCIGACVEEFGALTPECQGCASANLGETLETILSNCQMSATAYVFDGAFGIGLLSKKPLSDSDSMVFESHTNRRAVLYSKVDTDLGEVHAFCTHLTADLSAVPYPSATGSWLEEQAVQIDAMLAWIEEKSGGSGTVVLMGDMNTGPAIAGFPAEAAKNYAKFEAAGYDNPYANDSAKCTFCGDNSLVADGDDQSSSVVIDHILLSGFSGTATTKRILDQKVSIETADGTVEAELSDHFGLMSTLTQ